MNKTAKNRKLSRWSLSNFFLESGYVDIRQDNDLPIVSALDEAPVGNLYYPEHVRASLNESIPYLDEAVTENKNPERSYTTGMDSLAFQVSPPGNGIGRKRSAYFGVNGPSHCTGKLRLAVQAQLGKKDVDPAKLDQELKMPLLGYATRNRQGKTYVLYSGSENQPDYWLLTVEDTTVKAEKLKIPKRVENKFYKRLASASPANRDKIEAYLLSEIDFDSDVQPITVSFEELEGSSFALGWKANWLGNELSIVTNEAIVDNQGDTVYHTNRRYKLTISIDHNRAEDTYSISVTRSLEESVNCTPQNGKEILWYYEPALGKMKTFFWSSLSGYPETIDQDNAPMYCYYERKPKESGSYEEKLIVKRHKLETVANDGTTTEILQAVAAYRNAAVLCMTGAADDSKSWTSSQYTQAGFWCDDGENEPSGVDEKSNGRYVSYELTVSDNGNSVPSSPSFNPGFDLSNPGYCGEFIDDDGSWFEEPDNYPITVFEAKQNLVREIGSNIDTSGRSILVIPDAEDCAYIGNLEGVGGSVQYWNAHRERYYKLVSTIHGGVNGTQWNANGDGGGHGHGLGQSAWVANNSRHATIQRLQQYDVEFIAHLKQGRQSPETLSVESLHASDQEEAKEQALLQLGSWASWFFPQIAIDSTLERIVRVQEGMQMAIYTRDPTQPFGEDVDITDEEIPEDVRVESSGVMVGWV